jgi:hypothetical protein
MRGDGRWYHTFFTFFPILESFLVELNLEVTFALIDFFFCFPLGLFPFMPIFSYWQGGEERRREGMRTVGKRAGGGRQGAASHLFHFCFGSPATQFS